MVLDIFFEALNYEKIEQKKAYEIAGLLGKIRARVGSGLTRAISSLPFMVLSSFEGFISNPWNPFSESDDLAAAHLVR